MIGRLKNSLPGRLGVAYGQSQAGRYASALAFNSFTTMFPLILGILTIVGLVIRDPKTQHEVQVAIISVFPQDAHAQLLKALSGVKHNAGLLGVVSIVGLLVTATGYFSSMEWTLTQIFGSKQRDAIRQRLMGLVMMVVFVLAVVIAVAANGAAAIIPFAPVGGFIVGLLVMLALFITIYRFVPNRTFSVKQVLPGAILAAVLTEILTIVFPIYARIAHGFNTYGQTFALFFLLATWLYFLAQLLLLGAVFIRLRTGSPADEGLAATPQQESRGVPRPADVIEDQKQKRDAGVPADAPSGRGQRQQQPVAAPGGGDPGRLGGDPGRQVRAPAVTGPKKVIFGAVGSALGVFFATRSRSRL